VIPEPPAAPAAPDLLPQDLRDLLERRAARLRAPAPSPEEEQLFWVAEFPLGEERWALPLSALRAAVPLRMVTPVPLSPPHVVGILRFQGQIISALSLSALLGGHGWREDPAVLLVVDPGLGRLVALDCETIPKPVALPLSLVQDARARSHGAVCELSLPGAYTLRLLDVAALVSARGAARG
jgi:purine-binding chemotaxis protein CheW